MPLITAAIDPVTRLEGHLKVEVQIDTVQGVQQVVEAKAIGTLFRGFEKILEDRDPRDAPLITSRICGVCPTSHGLASALVLDRAFGVSGNTPQRTHSRLLRNLVHGACYLESHLLHFYLLSLPDFAAGLPVAPWLPGWNLDDRLDRAVIERLRTHFGAAVGLRRNAHEMGAIYGGQLPHSPAYVAGGFTAISSPADKALFGQYLDELLGSIETVYLPDVQLLASFYPDYFMMGKGWGHLMSFGVFELDNDPAPRLLFPSGRRPNEVAAPLAVDADRITEHVSYSWYDAADHDRNPAAGQTTPKNPKPPAYSWLKAPRYEGLPYECGPLARMTVAGHCASGVSVMDRHLARAREALLLAQAMRGWLAEIEPGVSAFTPFELPNAARAAGLTEAPRGALGHWLQVTNRKIAHYQVVTPTCWNVSPRDAQGQRGPLEQALIGVPVANADQPIEVLRVVHSLDPCLDCATHVLRAGATVNKVLFKSDR